MTSEREKARIFIDSHTLAQIAGSITPQHDAANEKRIVVFQNLKLLADSNAMNSFIQALLALIGEPPAATIQPKVKLGLDNLAALDPSEVPASSLTVMAGKLPSVAIALTDPNEKLSVIDILLRFAKKMGKESLDTVRQTLINPVLQIADGEFLVGLLTLCRERQFPTLTDASTFKTVLDRVAKDLQDSKVIRYLIENTSGDQRKQFVQVLANLVRTAP